MGNTNTAFNATFLSAKSKEYDFNGKSGISYSVRFIASGSILRLKVSKDDFAFFEGLDSETKGTLTISFAIYNEQLYPVFENFRVI